jgi:hypothetical protein
MTSPRPDHAQLQPIIVHEPPQVIVMSSAPDPWAKVQAIASLIISLCAFFLSIYVFHKSQLQRKRDREADIFRRVISDPTIATLDQFVSDVHQILQDTVSSLTAGGTLGFPSFVDVTIRQAIDAIQDKLYRASNRISDPIRRRDSKLAAECEAQFDKMEDQLTPWISSLRDTGVPEMERRQQIRNIVLELSHCETTIIDRIVATELSLYR